MYDQVVRMQTEFTDLRTKLSSEQFEKVQLGETVRRLEEELQKLMKQLDKVNMIFSSLLS